MGDRDRISKAYWPASLAKNLKLLRCPPLPSEPRHTLPRTPPNAHIYIHHRHITHTHRLSILAVMISADDPWRLWRTPQNNVHIHIYTNLRRLVRYVEHSNQDSLLCSSCHRFLFLRSWTQAGTGNCLVAIFQKFLVPVTWLLWASKSSWGSELLHPQQTSEGLRQQPVVSLELLALVVIHFNEYQRTDKGVFLTARALGVNASPSHCTCPMSMALSCHPNQHLSQPTPEILVTLMSLTCQLSYH